MLFDYENGAVIVVGEILRSFISNMMLDDVVIGSRISEVDVNMPNGCSIAMSNIQAMQKADNIEVIQTYDLSFHFNVVLVSCNLENILKEPISPSLRVEKWFTSTLCQSSIIICRAL